MTIRDLIAKNRSYRRFSEAREISMDALTGLVELARLSASAGNLQPLKYHLCPTCELKDKIFPTLAWAGYLPDWPGPAEGERPTAYITVLADKNINKSFCQVDAGIACQSILLGAVEQGLGGCIFGSVKRDQLCEVLNLPEHLEILYVIALGQPVEKVVVETAIDGNIKYHRDEDQTHHLPKRPLDELIINR